MTLQRPGWRLTRFHRPVAVIAVLGLVVGACTSTAATPSPTIIASAPPTETAAPTEPVNTDPIKIGVNLELTGAGAQFGTQNRDGLQLALDEINGAGGINGRPLELIIADNASDGSTASTVAERQADQDNVVAFLGAVTSGVSLALAATAEELGVPQLATQPSTPKFNEPLRWSFRIQADGNDLYNLATAKMAEVDGVKKLGVLATTATFGQEAKTIVTQIAGDYGVEVVLALDIEPNTNDATIQVQQLRDAGADGVQHWDIDGVTEVAVARAKRSLGWDVPFLVSGAAVGAMLKIMPAEEFTEDLNYRTGPTWWDPDHNARAAHFIELATAAGIDLPGDPGPIAFGYDALHVLAAALANVEFSGDLEADRAAVRDALEGLSGVPIAMGKGESMVSFGPDDHTGLHALEQGMYAKVVNGKPVPIE